MGVRKLNFSVLTAILGVTITLVGYQNCAKAKFTIDEGAKQKAIGDSDVFGGNDPTGIDPSVPVVNATPTPTPMPTATPVNTGGKDPVVVATPTPAPTPMPTATPSPVASGSTINLLPNSVCGPKTTDTANQATIKKTTKLVAALYLNQIFNQTLIQAWDSAQDQANNYAMLASLKPFSLKLKAPLVSGQYTVVMYDGNKVTSAPATFSLFDGINVVAPVGDSVVHTIDIMSKFTISANGVQMNPQSMNVLVGEVGDAICQTAGMIDPVILQLKTSKPQAILLSGPEDGVMFDLLGQKNNHKKVQISWFENAESENYFLVLPNKDGQVLGIDEMFGDATMGPDMKFAKQGFAALAKHDDTNDKMISDEDEVFSKLRLWKDSNLDGVVQANELYTLEEKGVVAIDLRYDKRYSETDKHGNMTRFKSVALMNDGSYSLVFDLWLRYLGK